MAEKTKGPVGGVGKPVPMKLFATWEVERTSPNCTPRLCTLTLTRLVVTGLLGNDLTSLIVAVKMQSSKRTLRSNDITVPTSGLLDTELDLTFSLQYPHFLKRGGNTLQIMLQRRKRYKNRPMLGFKTLAVGMVAMDQVLQRSMDRELELYSDVKEKSVAVAKVSMLSLTSQPVDHEEGDRHKMVLPVDQQDRVGDGDTYSDDEDEFSTNDEGSDSEPMIDDGIGSPMPRKAGTRKLLAPAARQKNFKQKFIALLKKFKVTDEGQDSELDHEELGHKIEEEMDPQEFEDLFDEIDDLSESGPEMDTMSVSSTPKPSLRPFFSSSRSLATPEKTTGTEKLSDDNSKKADSDSHAEGGFTDHEHSDSQQQQQTIANSPPTAADSDSKRLSSLSSDKKTRLFTKDKSTSFKEKKGSVLTLQPKEKSAVERSNSISQLESSPRKVLLEQLTKVFPTDDFIPECIILVNSLDALGQIFAQKLQEKQHRVVGTCSCADVRATITCLVNKIQKFCNNNSKAPLPIRVAVAGSDAYVNSVIRPYVEQLAGKPQDWLGYVKFLIIPFGHSVLAKYIGSVDPTYQAMFLDAVWKDFTDKVEGQKSDYQEIVNRTSRFLSGTLSIIQLPIAEAMVMHLTHKDKSSDDESSQIFIPFLNTVKIGASENSATTSVDIDEQSIVVPSQLSGSPPSSSSSGHLLEKPRDTTPPSSPSVPHGGTSAQTVGYNSASPSMSANEPMDLQIDYWSAALKGDTNRKPDANKSTLKSTFRSLQVTRLPCAGDVSVASQALSMHYVTKEKKQKIMRLGKKKERDKDVEPKSQVVDGINRLICLARNQPVKLSIDGMEWHGVKFFQLSAQWQTHVKYFPVAVFASSEFPQVDRLTGSGPPQPAVLQQPPLLLLPPLPPPPLMSSSS